MPQAIWNGQVIADSEETVLIEGNHYFPPGTVKRQFMKDSDVKTVCPWKGEAAYYDIEVDGKLNPNAAWYYPTPKEKANEIVGSDFANYVAFWHGVEVKDS